MTDMRPGRGGTLFAPAAPRHRARVDPLTAPDWPGPPLIVAVCNQKGGVGKSTVALWLAEMAARLDLRVLVVDTDPQGSLRKVQHVLRDVLHFNMAEETDPAWLARLRDVTGFDLVIVDTPGNLSAVEILGPVITYSNLAVIPSDMTVLSATETINTVTYVNKLGCRPRVLLNKLPPGGTQLEQEARDELAGPAADTPAIGVFRQVLWDRVVLRHAIRDRVSIALYESEQAVKARLELLAVLFEVLQVRPGLLAGVDTAAYTEPRAAG